MAKGPICIPKKEYTKSVGIPGKRLLGIFMIGFMMLFSPSKRTATTSHPKKDEKWLGIRQETKEVRKAETDQIKLFVEYARAQGSQHADRYYVSLTKLINRRLGIESGGRDKADQRTLMHLKSLETVVELHLATLMVEGLPYKEIYQGVKKFIEAL